MFSALISPSSYLRHDLHPSLYLLVALPACGYALALLITDRLDRYAERPAQSPISRSEFVTVAVRNRWAWLAPIWATTCVLILTLMPNQSRAANVFMYRFF